MFIEGKPDQEGEGIKTGGQMNSSQKRGNKAHSQMKVESEHAVANEGCRDKGQLDARGSDWLRLSETFTNEPRSRIE
jgi:hypothetical protein